MLKFLKTGIFLGGILLSLICKGQLPPLGTMPTLYNGSFAGEGDGPRIHSNVYYSDYKNDRRSNEFGIMSSYDQFIPAIRSGIGIGTIHYMSSFNENSFRGSSFLVSVAPKFSIKGKYTFHLHWI